MTVVSRELAIAEIAPDFSLVQEQALIAAAQTGDTIAFGDLYSLHVDAVRRRIGRLLGGTDPGTAEDLTQETFIKAMVKIDSFEERGKGVLPWLQTIALRTLLDYKKKAGQNSTVVTGFIPEPNDAERARPIDDAVIARIDLESYVKEVFGGISSPAAAAVFAVDIGGLSYQQASELLDMPVANIRTRLHRGRKRIRATLPPDEYLTKKPARSENIAS
jgi:RNA polymerase sigma-70 factor (ECF subfamily)